MLSGLAVNERSELLQLFGRRIMPKPSRLLGATGSRLDADKSQASVDLALYFLLDDREPTLLDEGERSPGESSDRDLCCDGMLVSTEFTSHTSWKLVMLLLGLCQRFAGDEHLEPRESVQLGTTACTALSPWQSTTLILGAFRQLHLPPIALQSRRGRPSSRAQSAPGQHAPHRAPRGGAPAGSAARPLGR